MAAADLRDELNCSICLDVYTDPVTLRCGHNFCRVCIDDVLESQRRQGAFTCPECRTHFKRRPWLQKNVTLANIAERFQSAATRPKEDGTFCTYCIHAAVPAVKSCLHCEASLCGDHLRVHSKSPEHILTEPSRSPQDKKCPIHKKALDYFCMKDGGIICILCMQEAKHRGHAVQTVRDAFRYKKERLESTIAQFGSERRENETQIQKLQEGEERAGTVATRLLEHFGALFHEIREKLDVLEVQTMDDITQQVDRNSQEVTDLIHQLQVKNDELSRKIDHLQHLREVTDPTTILQDRQTNAEDFCVAEKKGDGAIPKNALLNEVLLSLKLQSNLSEILTGVSTALDLPKLTALSFDKRTAASNVSLSGDLSIAYGTHIDPDVEDTRDRFDSHQVLSTLGLFFGCHYWEVELWDTNSWRIGMAYNSVERTGNNAVFGNTGDSWCLCKGQQGYFFRHDGKQVYLPGSHERFKRLGIYLDYGKGQLSFYNMRPEVSHLHTFNAFFTEPLFAAVRVGYGVWVKIIQ